MKLYYATGACSLAPHIALIEAGLKFELHRVFMKSKQLSDGTDFYQINPEGYVPVLQLKNGEILTECVAVLQYIADQAPASHLAPANGSFARYKLQSWLNFLATELHKNFSVLFNDSASSETNGHTLKKLQQRFSSVETQLNANCYLTGDYFTIADAYLFTLSQWADFLKFDLSPYPQLLTYLQTIKQRPAVLRALTAEGLIKSGDE